MKKILLNKGFSTIIDDSDFESLSKNTWFISDRGYVKRTLWENNKAKQIRMHRFLLEAKKDQSVDHINGDKLDNRRENLRICTNAQNMRNRSAPANNKSGAKGVTWMESRSKWRARIKFYYKEIHLGLFKEKKDAARAYNKAASKLFGEYAFLNKI